MDQPLQAEVERHVPVPEGVVHEEPMERGGRWGLADVRARRDRMIVKCILLADLVYGSRGNVRVRCMGENREQGREKSL